MNSIGAIGVNIRNQHPYVGYYDSSEQEKPVYDPGWGSTPCLVCWNPLGGTEGANIGGNIRTIGVLGHDGEALSLFYRVHITCADANPDLIVKIDSALMHGEVSW